MKKLSIVLAAMLVLALLCSCAKPAPEAPAQADPEPEAPAAVHVTTFPAEILSAADDMLMVGPTDADSTFGTASSVAVRLADGLVPVGADGWPIAVSELTPELQVDITYLGDIAASDPPEVLAVAIRVIPTEQTTTEPDTTTPVQPAEPEPELGGTPRDYMGKVLAYCQRYANSFTPESRGLMFIGSAGLGKTHMALAIADTVLNRGFDVLYTSSAALAAQLGREHFDRAAEDPWLDACKEADLLILDDLGTEYISQLTISVLYELINTRMLCHRPTIYTSNIVDSSIFEARYTEKVASRILGSCQIFKFFGTDQRLKRGGRR